MADPVLCYVSEPWAYFTTQPLDLQWGDDWDDAPYEYNAGLPYTPCWHRQDGQHCDCAACKRDWNDDGTPKWEIVRVAFDGSFETPADGCMSSGYSVRDINRGAIAWLRDRGSGVFIHAGTPLSEFKRLVRQAGGRVFVEEEARSQEGVSNAPVLRDKFDLARDILRQMEAERMDYMECWHVGYVLRVERDERRHCSSVRARS